MIRKIIIATLALCLLAVVSGASPRHSFISAKALKAREKGLNAEKPNFDLQKKKEETKKWYERCEEESRNNSEKEKHKNKEEEKKWEEKKPIISEPCLSEGSGCETCVNGEKLDDGTCHCNDGWGGGHCAQRETSRVGVCWCPPGLFWGWKYKSLKNCRTKYFGPTHAFGLIKRWGSTLGRCENIREFKVKCHGHGKGKDMWYTGQQHCDRYAKKSGCSGNRPVVNSCKKKKRKKRDTIKREDEVVEEDTFVDPELADDEEWEFEFTIWILPEINADLAAIDDDGLVVEGVPLEEDSLVIEDLLIVALSNPDDEMTIFLAAETGTQVESVEDTTQHYSEDDNTVIILAAALGAVGLTALIMTFTCYHYGIGCFRKSSKSLMPVPVHSHELDDVMMSTPTASGFAFEGEKPADYTIQPWHLQQNA